MDINQDEIDKMLQGGLVGGEEQPAASGGAAAEPDYSGVASQDDIDALFAAVGDADPEPDDVPAAAPEPAPAPEPAAPAAAAEPELDLDGVADQNDIDALFAAVGGDAVAEPVAPEPEPAAAPEAAAEPDIDLDGVADQDDIDALFSAVGGAAEAAPAPDPEPAAAAAPEPEPEPEPAPAAEPDAAADDGGTIGSQEDLDALLSSISAGEEGGLPEPEPAASAAEGADTEEFDMDELLRQVSEAAPPPPPPPSNQPMPDLAEEMGLPDYGMPEEELSPLAEEEAFSEEPAELEEQPPAAPAPAPIPEQPAPAPAAMVQPMPAPVQAAPAPAMGADVMAAHAGGVAVPSGPRREFSVLYGAGDIESVANQINALLNSMSEKAHGYMQSWIAADSEAKELRARALEEERRRTSLESEKLALGKQVDELRSRLGELEGGKVATEEAKRTLETTYQAKIRELESRVGLLSSEAESLKDELTRARNQATGVDIESRRVRFELDRLKSEVESERMERLRIQRALENREKEIQAMQAQSGGQASSLFIDELHRLVRRLETELDARSSGAHEALRQLDRLEISEDMVPVAANLRASLMHALGQDSDPNDALKNLGREASGVRGGAAVTPQKAEMVSFETALSTYNLNGAVDIAGTLLREATATPATLMKKIYQNPALRRPEVSDQLVPLARLMEGLRTVQESNDRSRGVESGDSEVFYVHMFDYLHNLVRLKLINRMSGDIWRLFLDLRGRFSFVTSDKQWAEYRDNTLRDRAAK